MPSTEDSVGIHFSGSWLDEERQRLRTAIRTFEDTWRQSARSSSSDTRYWVLVHESPPWGAYYFAHRLDVHDSLTGPSAAKLAETIEEAAREVADEN
jgi:hypothetical protein